MIVENILAMDTEFGSLHVPVVAAVGYNSTTALHGLEAANLTGLYVGADFGKAAKRVVNLSHAGC